MEIEKESINTNDDILTKNSFLSSFLSFQSRKKLQVMLLPVVTVFTFVNGAKVREGTAFKILFQTDRTITWGGKKKFFKLFLIQSWLMNEKLTENVIFGIFFLFPHFYLFIFILLHLNVRSRPLHNTNLFWYFDTQYKTEGRKKSPFNISFISIYINFPHSPSLSLSFDQLFTPFLCIEKTVSVCLSVCESIWKDVSMATNQRVHFSRECSGFPEIILRLRFRERGHFTSNEVWINN